MFFYDVHTFIDEKCMYGLKYKDVYIGSPALADDILLLSNTKYGIDRMMSMVVTYSKYWRISFSPSKTKCMIFGESKQLNTRYLGKRPFYLGSQPIEEVQQYVHLGIVNC